MRCEQLSDREYGLSIFSRTNLTQVVTCSGERHSVLGAPTVSRVGSGFQEVTGNLKLPACQSEGEARDMPRSSAPNAARAVASFVRSCSLALRLELQT